MGDVGDDYKFFNEVKKKRHLKWHKENRAVINKAKLKYKDTPQALIFREKGMKQVDFYPSTGRWKAYEEGEKGWLGHGKLYRGGAIKFVKWYCGDD